MESFSTSSIQIPSETASAQSVTPRLNSYKVWSGKVMGKSSWVLFISEAEVLTQSLLKLIKAY